MGYSRPSAPSAPATAPVGDATAAAATPSTGKAKFRAVGEVKAKSASTWTIGEVYCGYLIGSKTVKTQHKEGAIIYELRNSNEDGEVLDGTQLIWESSGLKLDRASMGQLVRIEYLGEETNPKNKRKYKKFDVQIADEFLPQ